MPAGTAAARKELDIRADRIDNRIGAMLYSGSTLSIRGKSREKRKPWITGAVLSPHGETCLYGLIIWQIEMPTWYSAWKKAGGNRQNLTVSDLGRADRPTTCCGAGFLPGKSGRKGAAQVRVLWISITSFIPNYMERTGTAPCKIQERIWLAEALYHLGQPRLAAARR